MGLFSKKTCEICGGKAGAIIKYKLADDLIMCADCREKCVPGLTSKMMKTMTVADIQANMEVAAKNRDLFANSFQASRTFNAGQNMNKPVIEVDEAHGWWANAQKGEGWVYRLDDITNYYMKLSTSRISDNDKSSKSFFDSLFTPSFYSGYPELPQCPPGYKITGMRFYIEMGPNDLLEDSVELDMMPDFFDGKEAISIGYQVSHELYSFINQWKNNKSMAIYNEANSKSSESDNAEAIKKLHDLMEQGLLTPDEFEAKKKQLLGL